MESLLVAVVSFEGAVILALAGFAFKTRADAAGWKVSYEREKARADDMAAANRDARLATDIATKVAGALANVATTKGATP